MSFANHVRVMNDLCNLEIYYHALEILEMNLEKNIIDFSDYTNNYIAINHDITDIYTKHNCPTSIELL